MDRHSRTLLISANDSSEREDYDGEGDQDEEDFSKTRSHQHKGQSSFIVNHVPCSDFFLFISTKCKALGTGKYGYFGHKNIKANELSGESSFVLQHVDGQALMFGA